MPEQAAAGRRAGCRGTALHHPPRPGLLRRHQPDRGRARPRRCPGPRRRPDPRSRNPESRRVHRLPGRTPLHRRRRARPTPARPRPQHRPRHAPRTRPARQDGEAASGGPLRAPLRRSRHRHRYQGWCGPGPGGEPPPRRHRRPGQDLVRQPRHPGGRETGHRPQRPPPRRGLRDPRPAPRTNHAAHRVLRVPLVHPTRPDRRLRPRHPLRPGRQPPARATSPRCADATIDSKPTPPGPTRSWNPGRSCGPAPTATSSSATTKAPSTSPPNGPRPAETAPPASPTHPTSSHTAPDPAEPIPGGATGMFTAGCGGLGRARRPASLSSSTRHLWLRFLAPNPDVTGPGSHRSARGR